MKLKTEKENKLIYFFLLALVLEGVVTRGSGSTLGDSIATSGTAGSSGCVGDADDVANGGATNGPAATDGVGIRGSVESGGLICLSMMRAKYRSSSMLCS